MLNKFLNKAEVQEIEKLISEGYLTFDEMGRFKVIKYTEQTVFSQHWTYITLECRGLVVTSDWEIVGRPFDKFFNHNEPNSDFKWNDLELGGTITEKLDGSLGVLFWDDLDLKWRICTQGSFKSDQAIWANNWISENEILLCNLQPRNTYLFEIIYPENKIVVDYSGKSGLFLLGGRNTTTGEDIPLKEILYVHKVKTYSIEDFKTLFSNQMDTNFEGFILYQVINNRPRRIKFKFDHYVYLHKLYSSLTVRNVFNALVEDKVDSLIQTLPDESYDVIKSFIDEYVNKFEDMKQFLEMIWTTKIQVRFIKTNYSDESLYFKDVANFIKTEFSTKFHTWFFSKMRNLPETSLDSIVWKLVSPDKEIMGNKL